MIKRMIREDPAELERALLAAARKIEFDPRFASIREVSDDIDRIAGEAVQDAQDLKSIKQSVRLVLGL